MSLTEPAIISVIYFAAIELIKELMNYEVMNSLLSGLVALLRPSAEDTKPQQEILDG